MNTRLPAPADNWARIEAGHNAVDALNNIIGELRGLLEHDPGARTELQTNLCILLGPEVEPASEWTTSSDRFHVRNHPGGVVATVEHTRTGCWHAYVSEPACSWSYSDTFEDQATARGAADTAAAWWLTRQAER